MFRKVAYNVKLTCRKSQRRPLLICELAATELPERNVHHTEFTGCQFNKILKLGLTWMMGRRVSMTLLPVSSIFWSRAHCSNWATLYLCSIQIGTGFLSVALVTTHYTIRVYISLWPDLHAPRPVTHVLPQQQVVQAASAEEVEHLQRKCVRWTK